MLSSFFAMLLSYPALVLRLSTGSSFPSPLSYEEESHYLELYAKGDMDARNILIERNLRLVAHIIKKYYTQACDQDDLISIGTIGLIKGISSYCPDKGVRLATYASRCIENEVLMYFRSLKKSAGELSLSDSIETDKEGNALSLMDVICVDDDLFENVAKNEMCGLVKTFITSLPQKEREIITLRYGLDGKPPKPQREVATLMGISRSYVSRIEKRAIEKLRSMFD